MRHFIQTHGPQTLETLVCIMVFFTVRHGIRYAVRATILRSTFKALEKKEVVRIVDLLLLMLTTVVIVAIWGVKQSELLVFATSVITVLGVAFFAEMSVLSNITAFLVIFFQHPVKIGDRIKVHDGNHDLEGELVDITYFFTHIRTDEGGIVTLPNAVFLKSAFMITSPKRDQRSAVINGPGTGPSNPA